MNFKNNTLGFTAWLALAILGLAPPLAALDHGGVFAWTEWAMAWAVCIALALAAVSFFGREAHHGLRPLVLACLLGLAAAYVGLQSLPLPAALTRLLAPGVHTVYAQWLTPLEAADPGATFYPQQNMLPMSIAPWRTRARFGLLAVVAGFALVASAVITTRRRIMWLLIALAAGGVLHAVLGIAGILIDPTQTIWGQKAGAAFGAYINQNNASPLMILGMAGSIGLLAWRLSALSGFLQNADRINAAAFREFLSDSVSVVAAIGCALCLAGLLTNGSRGALAGAVFAIAMGLGYFHYAIGRRGRAILLAGVACGLIAAFVLVRFDVPLRSVAEINRGEENIAAQLMEKARWDHWSDARQASLVHWTTGAGGGTYRYAYLPHQSMSSPAWFANADNLWVEWLVETGLVGVILLSLLLWAVGTALWKLGRASDPLDFGLGAAAAVALAGLSFTQFFDFGLLLIPAAAATAVLFATATARAAQQRRQDRQRGPRTKQRDVTTTRRVLLRLLRNRHLALVAFLVLALGSMAAVPTLRAAAASEFLDRAAVATSRGGWPAVGNAAPLTVLLQEHVERYPSDSTTQLRLSQMQVLQAREHAARSAMATATAAETQQVFAALHPRQLRTAWYAQLPALSTELPASTAARQLPRSAASPLPLPLFSLPPADGEALSASQREIRGQLAEQMATARQAAAQALHWSPLSDEARHQLVRLDFAGGAPEQSRQALAQMASLRRQNSSSLRQVADLATEANMWDLAGDIWRRILTISPGHVRIALQSIRDRGPLRPSDIVPHTPEALAAAATIELSRPNPDRQLLTTAEKILSAHMPLRTIERAERQKLLAAIKKAIEKK